MAWTNPKTWFDGEHVGASELNAQLRDNLNELRRGCIVVANQAARNALTGVASGQLIWQQDISRLLVYDGEFWREVVYETSDYSYEVLSISASSGVAVYGNNTTMVDVERTDTGDAWDRSAYSTNGWQAPVTLEFLVMAATTDNSRSYQMISLNSDPTTSTSYTDLDYAVYPYRTDFQEIYNNNSYVGNGPGGSWSSSELYRIVYDTGGNILHYNGSKLMYSVSTGSSSTVRYFDCSINRTGHGIHRIRAIRKTWNGLRYV